MKSKELHPITIPIQLISLIFNQDCVSEFKVFVVAKMLTPGRFHRRSPEFDKICSHSCLQSRTVLKHLNNLALKGWISYDSAKCMYYLRSWSWFRKREIFYKRISVTIKHENLDSFRAFLSSAVISAGIKTQFYCYTQKAKNGILKIKTIEKPGKSATIIRGVASQDMPDSYSQQDIVLPYFGYSNQGIANLLGYKLTRACELKHEAESEGYLKTRPHFLLIQELSSPVPNIRQSLYKAFGNEASKIRIIQKTRRKTKITMIVKQLHDEIIPLIELKKVDYRRMLR